MLLQLSVLIYRPNLSAHRYRTPHIIAIGYLVFAALVAAWLSVWMSRENKRRDLIMSDKKEDDDSIPLDTDKRGYSLGDRDVRYRYVV